MASTTLRPTGLDCLRRTTTPRLVLGFLGVLNDRGGVLRSDTDGSCIQLCIVGVSCHKAPGTSSASLRYLRLSQQLWADGRCCESEQHRVRCPPQPSLPYTANNGTPTETLSHCACVWSPMLGVQFRARIPGIFSFQEP